MATKYLIEGAAFCGDGTASNEAASAGAPGAWNNINILEGTTPPYGTLAAGDHVHIRSKTSAGANIQRTLAASVNLGSTAATATAPITWLLDDGTIWSGINGTAEWLSNSNSYQTVFRANNIIAAKTPGNLIVRNSVAAGAGPLATISGVVKNVKFDWSAKTGTGRSYIILGNQGVLDSPIVKWGVLGNESAYSLITGAWYSSGVDYLVINPDIELQAAGPGRPIFGGAESNASGNYTVIGGRIWGAGSNAGGQAVFAIGSGGVSGAISRAIGLEYPRAMSLFAGQPAIGASYEAIACEAGGGGGELVARWGSASSRLDNNPPSLAAALPNSAGTPWAWRIYPQYADLTNLMRMASAKLYQGDAEVRTITQELLIANTMAPTKRSMWLTVQYIDNATGLPKSVTSQDFAGGALDASTANWSATVWGVVTFDKRKVAVTTPTAVKKDTMIEVTLMGYDKSATANDIYIMDPDFGIN